MILNGSPVLAADGHTLILPLHAHALLGNRIYNPIALTLASLFLLSHPPFSLPLAFTPVSPVTILKPYMFPSLI